MNGIDPGTIANTALTYFGGAAGAEISGAAIIITVTVAAASPTNFVRVLR
jgi:hypothetical protein